ncbi:hypothetical protein J1614_010665 [Plenodomus biglobosus]|nr:hypothetical protein J1614_010665 [Plenodomus biglobosus]
MALCQLPYALYLNHDLLRHLDGSHGPTVRGVGNGSSSQPAPSDAPALELLGIASAWLDIIHGPRLQLCFTTYSTYLGVRRENHGCYRADASYTASRSGMGDRRCSTFSLIPPSDTQYSCVVQVPYTDQTLQRVVILKFASGSLDEKPSLEALTSSDQRTCTSRMEGPLHKIERRPLRSAHQ